MWWEQRLILMLHRILSQMLNFKCKIGNLNCKLLSQIDWKILTFSSPFSRVFTFSFARAASTEVSNLQNKKNGNVTDKLNWYSNRTRFKLKRNQIPFKSQNLT